MKDYIKTIIIIILGIAIQFILNRNVIYIFDRLISGNEITKLGVMNLVSLLALSLMYILPVMAFNNTKKLKG